MGDESGPHALAIQSKAELSETSARIEYTYTCDRCGATMVERNCKIICTNCGHRFDCSDLNIYFD